MGTHKARPTEAKVIAGTAGAAAGQVITGFALYLLEEFFYGPAPVPVAVALFVGLVVTTGLVAGAAWWAPHTVRRDIERSELPGSLTRYTGDAEEVGTLLYTRDPL